LVAIPWLIREIGQRDGGVDVQEVGLELLSAHHADGPRVPGRRSARRLSANSSSRFSCVLIWPCAFGCTRFGGQSARRGRTVRAARTIRFSRCSAGGLGGDFRQSTVNPRTICQAPADIPPGPYLKSLLSFGPTLWSEQDPDFKANFLIQDKRDFKSVRDVRSYAPNKPV
jgi:hypothetical protein